MGVFSSELSEFGAKSALLDIFMRPYSSAEAIISQTRGLSTPNTYSHVLGSKR